MVTSEQGRPHGKDTLGIPAGGNALMKLWLSCFDARTTSGLGFVPEDAASHPVILVEESGSARIPIVD